MDYHMNQPRPPMGFIDYHQPHFEDLAPHPVGSSTSDHYQSFNQMASNPYYVPDTQDWNTAFFNEQSSGTMGNLMNSNPCQLPGTSYMQYYQPYPNCQLDPVGSSGRLLEIGGPLDNAITGSGRHDEGARSTEQHSLLNHPREVVRHPPASIMPYVVIKNANQEEWDLMTPMCELRVEESGRRLDPSLKFNVIGLDKDKRYKVKMTFLWSEMEKDGQYGNDWKKTKQSIVLEPKLGSDWMSDGIDFSSLSLTTHISSGNTHELAVLAGHVYQPKLVITEVNDDSKVHEHLDQTLKFNVIGNETPYSKKLEKRLKECRKQRLPEDLAGLSEKDLFVVPEAFRNAPNEIPVNREPAVHRNPPENRSSVQNGTMKALEPFPLDSHLSQQPAQMNPFGNYPHPPDPHPPRPNGYFVGDPYSTCPNPYHAHHPQNSDPIHRNISNSTGHQSAPSSAPQLDGSTESDGRQDQPQEVAKSHVHSAPGAAGVEAVSLVPPVVITNANQEEWDLMKPMCEIDVNGGRTRRRITPSLMFTVTGLNPTKRYDVRLFFLRSVEMLKNSKKVEFEMIDEETPQSRIEESGEELMRVGIDFSFLRLVSERGDCDRKEEILVRRKYVYQPKLVITEMDVEAKRHEHSDDCLRFLVTSTASAQLLDLKRKLRTLREEKTPKAKHVPYIINPFVVILNYPRVSEGLKEIGETPSVVIKNANQEEWDHMKPMCEMTTWPIGRRRMNPPLKFTVTGLDPTKQYDIQLEFVSSVKRISCYNTPVNEFETVPDKILNIVKSGAELTRLDIDFSPLSIATLQRHTGKPGMVMVQEDYVYQPKLVITEIGDQSKKYEHSDRNLRFVVRTQKTNRIITMRKRLEALREIIVNISSPLKTIPSILITSANQKEWDVSQPMAEIEVGNLGRLLDPPLKFTVTGLDEKKKYRMRLTFLRSKHCSESARKAVWEEDKQRISLEPRLGEYWMTAGIDFSFLRLSTVTGSENIVVIEKHVYVPKLIITECDNRCAMHEYLDIPHKFLVVSAEVVLLNPVDSTGQLNQTGSSEMSQEVGGQLDGSVGCRTASERAGVEAVSFMPSVVISNANQEEWDLMKPMCEVVANGRTRRCITPSLTFTVTGLNPTKRYDVRLFFLRSVEKLNDSKTVEFEMIDDKTPQSRIEESGEELMRVGIDFSFLRLVCEREDCDRKEEIVVRREYVYQPKLVITEIDVEAKRHEHSDDSLRFLVTSRASSRLEDLKRKLRTLREEKTPKAKHVPYIINPFVVILNYPGVSEGLKEIGETPSVVIKNANQEEWDLMKPMCETNTYAHGKRRLNPPLKFTVTGLDPTKQYDIQLEFLRSVRKIYCYNTPVNEFETVPDKILNIVKSGAELTRLDIDFSSLSIATLKKHTGKPGVVMVQRDYVYQPKLVITEIGDQSKKYEHSDRNVILTEEWYRIGFPKTYLRKKSPQTVTEISRKETSLSYGSDSSSNNEHCFRIPMNERMSGRHDASCAPQLSQVDLNGQLHHPTSSKRLIEVGGQLENATDSSNGQDESTQSTEPERREGHQREVVSNSPSAPVLSGSATETTDDEGGSTDFEESDNDMYFDEQDSDCPNQEVSRDPVSLASETPSVVIKNANQEEWDLMKPMCEMIAFAHGKRRMNPPLKFTVTGLDPTKQYEIQLEFLSSVEKMNSDDTPVNEFETTADKTLQVLIDNSGVDLMESGIDFSFLCIATLKKHTGKRGVMVVQEDYVYQPKLVITEIGDQSKRYEHSDRNLRFVVRTQKTNRITTMRKRLDSLREGIVPGTKTSSLVSMIPSVVITNANQKEWDLVQPMCEVVAKPNGIRLNPPLIFSVTGLDEEKMYEVKVTFSRSEQMIEKEEELSWEGKQFIWQKSSLSISLGAMSGSDLMRNRINFALFRLSVLSGYAYLPKVVITEVENPSEVHEHLDDKLKFFVMTYETPRVKELKRQFEALIHAKLDEKLHRLLECMRERARRRKEENKRKNEEKKAVGANRQKESTSTKTKRAPIEHPAEQKRREEGRNNARGERAKRRAETAENPLPVKKRSRRKGLMTVEMQVERSETPSLVMRLRSKK